MFRFGFVFRGLGYRFDEMLHGSEIKTLGPRSLGLGIGLPNMLSCVPYMQNWKDHR